MTRAPQPQFKPAFQVGDRVRVNRSDSYFGGAPGIVIKVLSLDNYLVTIESSEFYKSNEIFARKELERA